MRTRFHKPGAVITAKRCWTTVAAKASGLMKGSGSTGFDDAIHSSHAEHACGGVSSNLRRDDQIHVECRFRLPAVDRTFR
ncbi:MAG: hypothetical protein DMF97_03790 [Acidobacteria bacterium]|nr:MAG: hypothetical protein DMF97_03790 [Acidobacteriota bacterium]